MRDEKRVMTMPGSKVKVTVRSPWKLEIRPFWTIFIVYLLPIYNGGWQMTTDSYIRGQYLKFTGSDFWNSFSFFVTWPLNSGPNHVWQLIFLSLCDLYQTWYTGSTRWEMHNGMTLTRIQGQGYRDPNALAEVDRQSPYGANFWAHLRRFA